VLFPTKLGNAPQRNVLERFLPVAWSCGKMGNSGSPNVCIRDLVLKKCLSGVNPGSNSSLQLNPRIISESFWLVQCQHRISSVITALASVSAGSAGVLNQFNVLFVEQDTGSWAPLPIPR